jgi:hypothetical protein
MIERYITLTSDDVNAELLMTDDVLITVYNRNLMLPNNFFIIETIKTLKAELVKRNIVSEDHEGPIETI